MRSWIVGLFMAAILAVTSAYAKPVQVPDGVISPDALFGELGIKPTKEYQIDDGAGWLYATSGVDAWDETKEDPEGGPSFKVEYRDDPFRINIAMQQYLDEPIYNDKNKLVSGLFYHAITVVTHSDEAANKIKDGAIAEKSRGYVNGMVVTAGSDSETGYKSVTIKQ